MNTESANTPDVLARILQRKLEEVSSRQAENTITDLVHKAREQSAPRGFIESINRHLSERQVAVIAEIKKASPSKGVIRLDFDPVDIARSYEEAGAACLSILTDRDFFQGSEEYLMAARNCVQLPVIRKDFLITEYQIYEARAIGADAVLLIVAAFPDQNARLKDLYQLAVSLGMDVLVEVHNEAELAVAMALDIRLVGINNRNLHTFATSLDTTISLARQIPDTVTVVTESGIRDRRDVALMKSNGIRTFLVGETFMRAENPGEALDALFF